MRVWMWPKESILVLSTATIMLTRLCLKNYTIGQKRAGFRYNNMQSIAGFRGQKQKGTGHISGCSFLYFLSKTKYSRLQTIPQIIAYIGAWDRIYKRKLIEANHLRFPEGLIYEDHLFHCSGRCVCKENDGCERGIILLQEKYGGIHYRQRSKKRQI